MSRQLIKGCARHSFRDYEMKKFIISAVMALLIGGFAFTANAQDEEKKKAEATSKAVPKVAAQTNNHSLQANEYQGMVDAFVAAVNEFSTAYKSSVDSKGNGKSFTPDQMEKLMKKAESKYNEVNKYYEKLSKSQKQAVDNAKKLFDQTKDAFLKK